MTPERGPVFLARRTYRRRRLADAARLLPIIGTVLICIPLLWQGEGASGATRTTMAMFYIFGLWVLLALIAGIVSRYLRASENEEPPRGVGD
jgi:fatty acid desaturase